MTENCFWLNVRDERYEDKELFCELENAFSCQRKGNVKYKAKSLLLFCIIGIDSRLQCISLCARKVYNFGHILKRHKVWTKPKDSFTWASSIQSSFLLRNTDSSYISLHIHLQPIQFTSVCTSAQLGYVHIILHAFCLFFFSLLIIPA